MNYRVYYNNNGRIVGVLPTSQLTTNTTYAEQIQFDDYVDLESELQDYQIVFQHTIQNGELVEGVHDDIVAKQQLKLVQGDRKFEYPSLQDFVDAYYWKEKGDSSKMDEYIARVDAVKSKYPKPE